MGKAEMVVTLEVGIARTIYKSKIEINKCLNTKVSMKMRVSVAKCFSHHSYQRRSVYPRSSYGLREGELAVGNDRERKLNHCGCDMRCTKSHVPEVAIFVRLCFASWGSPSIQLAGIQRAQDTKGGQKMANVDACVVSYLIVSYLTGWSIVKKENLSWESKIKTSSNSIKLPIFCPLCELSTFPLTVITNLRCLPLQSLHRNLKVRFKGI